jgi:hypothetical protein
MSGVAAKRTKWEAEKELAPVVITPIAPAALHDVWDLVRDDLDECRKHDTSTTWMEDIYSSLRNAWATLYLVSRGEEHMGCLLLQLRTDPWESIPILHIWMCANHGGHNILKDGQPQLDEIARSCGARTITFRSDRLSFERLCRDLGYRLREIELVRELDHG